MAEKIIVDIETNTAGAVQGLAQLKDQMNTLRAAMKTFDTSTESGRQKWELYNIKLKELQKTYSDNLKMTQANRKANEEQDTSLKGMAERLSALTRQYKSLNAEQRNSAEGQSRLQEIKQLTDALKQEEAAMGDFRRNVGNYEGAISKLFPYFGKLQSALSGLGVNITNIDEITSTSLKAMASSVKTNAVAMGKSILSLSKTILATPIGWLALAIGAVVLAAKQLVDAFKKNDDAMTALQKLMASFRPILDAVTKAFASLVEALTPVFDWLAEKLPTAFSKVIKFFGGFVTTFLGGIKSLLDGIASIADTKIGQTLGLELEGVKNASEKLGNTIEKVTEGINSFADGVATAAKNSQNLVTAMDELEEKQRQYQRNEAVRNAEISELRAKSAEKDKYTNEERLSFLNQAIELEKANLKERRRLAEEEYRLEVANNKRNQDTSDEAKQRETDLFVSMQQARTDYNNGIRRLNSEMSTLRKEIRKEYDDLIALAPELTAAMQEMNKSADELELANAAKPFDELIQKAQDGIAKFSELGRELTAEEQQNVDQLNEIIVKATEERVKAVENAQKEIDKKSVEQRAKTIEAESAFAVESASVRIKNEKDLAAEIYRLRMESLNQQMALYDVDSEEYAKLYNKKLQLDNDYQKQLATFNKQQIESARKVTDSVVEYITTALNTFSVINDAMDEVENAELERYKERNDTQKEILENRLKSGLISQEQYERQVEQLDAAYDKKSAELSRKQAQRKKALNIFQATIDTAGAIIGFLRDPSGIAGIVLSALAAATGAAQIATIAATPLPKAARGGVAGGGLLQGASHAQGGIAIEAEGGEAIINKRSTAKYRDLLSAINQAGGGVSFAHAGGRVFANGGLVNDGGYSVRSARTATADALKDVKIYTTIEDIRRGDANYTQIINNKTL